MLVFGIVLKQHKSLVDGYFLQLLLGAANTQTSPAEDLLQETQQIFNSLFAAYITPFPNLFLKRVFMRLS